VRGAGGPIHASLVINTTKSSNVSNNKQDQRSGTARPVTFYELRVMSYKLQVTSYQLRVTSYELRVTSYALEALETLESLNYLKRLILSTLKQTCDKAWYWPGQTCIAYLKLVTIYG
jgi:hypothetical protein